MSYYHTCPICGSHLDPGERCDCRKENAAVGTRNTSGGEGGTGWNELIPPPIVPENQTEVKEDL